MLQIKYAEYEELIHKLESFVGKRLLIAESITRSRSVGHDRHFATSSRLEMILESVGTYLSGAQLALLGEGSIQYGASAASIVSVSLGDEVVEVIEWYESQTERKTTIQVLG